MAESLLEDNYKLMFEFQTKNTKIIKRTITLLFSGIYSGYYPFFGVQHYSIQSIVRVKYLELN